MYTGNSKLHSYATRLPSVYPCVYRELEQPQGGSNGLNGLSLCIQGTQYHFTVRRHSGRFIPVYTGNSIGCTGLESDFSVYPCVYRELVRKQKKGENENGLSLCIQGTLYKLKIYSIL